MIVEITGLRKSFGTVDARARADELLAEFDLTEAADRRCGTFSGGMRRRLDLAASMIGRPRVLFLDELADRVTVIDHGRAIAEGTPGELKRRIGGAVCHLSVAEAHRARVHDLLSAHGAVSDDGTELTVPAHGPQTLVEVVRLLDEHGLEALDIGLRQPTLDDVFLTLTGDPRP